MRPTFRPLHLLLLADPSAHHLVHSALHEPCGNRLAVALSLAINRDQVAIILDIGAKLLHSFGKLLELGVHLFEVHWLRVLSIDHTS